MNPMAIGVSIEKHKTLEDRALFKEWFSIRLYGDTDAFSLADLMELKMFLNNLKTDIFFMKKKQ